MRCLHLYLKLKTTKLQRSGKIEMVTAFLPGLTVAQQSRCSKVNRTSISPRSEQSCRTISSPIKSNSKSLHRSKPTSFHTPIQRHIRNLDKEHHRDHTSRSPNLPTKQPSQITLQNHLTSTSKMPAIPAYSTYGGPTPPNTPIVTAMAGPIVCLRQTSKFALLSAEILTKILKMDTHSTSISASLTCKKLHVVNGAMKWHRHAYGGTNWYWVQRDI